MNGAYTVVEETLNIENTKNREYHEYTLEEATKATLEYFNGDELATNVFITKYALKTKNGKLVEKTPDDMHDRLAKEFSRIEKSFGGDNALSYDKVRAYLDRFKQIVPQGSPMMGIGNNHANVSLSNCVVVESPSDNISSIVDTGKDLANLFKRRCGVGLDISNLRPEGAVVSNSAGTTTGAWSFADFYSYICRMVGQNGRRGALMITIDVRHPDIEQFITMKSNLAKVTGANISVRISNEFMNAVNDGIDFDLQFPVESKSPSITKKINAKKLWDLIISSARDTAEPGLIMWDNMINNLPAHCYSEFKTISTNPCVTGDTRVMTSTGERTIEELTDNNVEFFVYSYNIKNDEVELKRATAFKTRDNAKLLQITTKSGKVIKLTPDHRVYTDKGWIEAQNLTIEHKTLCANAVTVNHLRFEFYKTQFDEISLIEEIEPASVYDLSVDDNHNFFANNILVHNCAEIALSAYDSCRLITINLKHFIKNRFTKKAHFDFNEFKDVIHAAMRLSDDLVQLEIEKLLNICQIADSQDEKALWNKMREACINGRRVGLGTHALADALANLNIAYDSDEALKIVDSIYKTLRDEAYRESINLAKERGAFKIFNWDKEKNNIFIKRLPQDIQNDIEKYGRRNIAILTNAPTGSTSIESQTSSGIEPVYSNSYVRRRKLSHNEKDIKPNFIDKMGDKWLEYNVLHKNIQEYLTHNNTSEIPAFFVESNNINWEKRIEIQSIIQQYIDHSISSTINLPTDVSKETVANLYFMGWQKGLKGITVYRAGARDGVLINNTEKSNGSNDIFPQHSAPKRPESLKCDIRQYRVKNEDWTIVIGLLDDKPYEVFGGRSEFVEIPKTITSGMLLKRKITDKVNRYDLQCGVNGETFVIKNITNAFQNKDYSTFTRILSLALRHGANSRHIVEQLLKDNGETFDSFSRVMSRVIKEYIRNGTKINGKVCPDCANTNLIYQDGCVSCTSCSWSQC